MGGLIMIVVTYAALPATAATAGGLLGAFKPPRARLKSAIQHFAAGVVFAVVASELLPDIMRRHKPIELLIGFTLGVIAMLGVRSFTRNVEQLAQGKESLRGTNKWPSALIAAVAAEVLIDGFILGVGFAAGDKEGWLLTLALTVELLSLGLAGSITLGKTGIEPVKAAMVITGLSLMIVIGGVVGVAVPSGLPEGAFDVLLSSGFAALLFLITEQLLVEAHEVRETSLSAATFFAGFLIFVVIGMNS